MLKLVVRNSASFLLGEPKNMAFNSRQGTPMIIKYSKIKFQIITMTEITILDHYTV